MCRSQANLFKGDQGRGIYLSELGFYEVIGRIVTDETNGWKTKLVQRVIDL